MVNELKDSIRENRLLEQGDKLILTVSGGLDSMVLAHLFLNAGIDFGIAHCNFTLRGAESDEDAEFVKDFADSIEAPFFLKTFDTVEYARKNKLSIQVAARNLRYEWFESLIDETDFDFYATAHHFDDQVETFFINLFRGGGMSGLRGILPKNGNCIRPMLFAGRSQILKYATENNIKFREDSSNAKNDYLRNRIRHIIIPAMEQTKPDFRDGMRNSFKSLAGAEKFIAKEIADFRSEFLIQKEGVSEISFAKLLKNDEADFVLFELLKPFGFNCSTIKDILNAKAGISGKSFFSSTHQIVFDRDKLLLFPIITELEDSVYKIESSDRKVFKPIALSLEIKKMDEGFKIEKNSRVAQLDYGKMSFPLTIRKYKQGDFFYPFGMKGRKKLSDFFIDRKFSLYHKQNVWLLLSGNEIVWVMGHRIDDRFRITENTTKILTIRII